MTYRITDEIAGSQAIAETSTTKNHELGTIVRAVDETYGEGEFIYLLGVASTTVGAVVSYDVATVSKWQTALATTAVAKSFPLAVAMSANVAGPNYGWYQISGLAVASKLVAASMVVGSTISVAGGEVDVSVTSNIVQGAMTALVASANTSDAVTTVLLCINRPANAAIA